MDRRTSDDQRSIGRSRPMQQRSGMRRRSPNSIASMLDGPPKRGRDPGGKSINPRCHQLAGWFSADATVHLTLTLTFCARPAIRLMDALLSLSTPLPKDRGKPSKRSGAAA